MSSEPLVSVVMPFLNAERFMAEAIDSVRGQSLGSWELLLVDDSSTDASAAIAEAAMAADPARIRAFRQPGHEPRGASAARNVAIAAARGRYLAMLDADDLWLPRKLEEQVPLLERNPDVGVVYGNSLYWYGWNDGAASASSGDYSPDLGVRSGEILHPPRLIELTLLGLAAVPCTNSLLIRTDLARAVGGFEQDFKRLYEDQVFYAKLFLESPVLPMATIWDLYRQHEDSSCATAERSGEAASARAAYLSWLEQYLAERGMQDSSVWRAMQTELRLLSASPAEVRARRFARKVRRRVRGWIAR